MNAAVTRFCFPFLVAKKSPSKATYVVHSGGKAANRKEVAGLTRHAAFTSPRPSPHQMLWLLKHKFSSRLRRSHALFKPDANISRVISLFEVIMEVMKCKWLRLSLHCTEFNSLYFLFFFVLRSMETGCLKTSRLTTRQSKVGDISVIRPLLRLLVNKNKRGFSLLQLAVYHWNSLQCCTRANQIVQWKQQTQHFATNGAVSSVVSFRSRQETTVVLTFSMRCSNSAGEHNAPTMGCATDGG